MGTICIKKLKLNKFRVVCIPSNKDLFMRVGPRSNPNFEDGQVANYTNGGLEALDEMEAQLIKESQMPLDTKV